MKIVRRGVAVAVCLASMGAWGKEGREEGRKEMKSLRGGEGRRREKEECVG